MSLLYKKKRAIIIIIIIIKNFIQKSSKLQKISKLYKQLKNNQNPLKNGLMNNEQKWIISKYFEILWLLFCKLLQKNQNLFCSNPVRLTFYRFYANFIFFPAFLEKNCWKNKINLKLLILGHFRSKDEVVWFFWTSGSTQKSVHRLKKKNTSL